MDAKKRRLNARTGGLPLDQVLHPTAVSYIEFTNDAMTLRQTSNPSSGWRQTKPPASPSVLRRGRSAGGWAAIARVTSLFALGPWLCAPPFPTVCSEQRCYVTTNLNASFESTIAVSKPLAYNVFRDFAA